MLAAIDANDGDRNRGARAQPHEQRRDDEERREKSFLVIQTGIHGTASRASDRDGNRLRGHPQARSRDERRGIANGRSTI